ncbi:B-cell receptor CD22-like isoform X1 [Astyanax mexicanus]|uniref:B-cell receptor CD22-like isoform X1 n=1 Tax=Astyanax mexicanus TaxID=7994 RepID=A0A8T2MKS9_ASTMX|nr:B-cell receptor CD22-like isoform X1 [Astyanax mexicanus]
MNRNKVLGIFLTVSALISLCHGWDVQVSESVTAVDGSCVTLPCSTSPHSDVVWYLSITGRDPIVYSSNTGDITDSFRRRTSVSGDPAQGDCSLKIDRVRSDDNGEILYPWIHPDTGNQYHYTKINVEKPRTPEISIESSQVEGTLFSAHCAVQHSCPSSPPSVQWFGLSILSDSVTTTKNQDGLWTSVTQAQFRPNHQDHEKSLSCQSSYSGKTLCSNALKINVFYAPTNVRITGTEGAIIEGKSVSLTCTSNSNPPPIDYEWYLNQVFSTNQSKAEFFLEQVKRDTSVSCTARNSYGRGQSEETELKVHFPPTILLDSACSDWTGGMRCVCRAEAEPRASITWMVNGSSFLPPNFTALANYTGRVTVSELTGPLTLNVSCEASNYLDRSSYEIPMHQPLSGGTVGFILAAVLFVVLGIVVVAVICLKKRRKPLSADSSKRSHTDLSGLHTRKCETDETIYMNDTGHLYTDTMRHHPTQKNEIDVIYENY